MNEFAGKLEEARRRLPLQRLMEQHGKGPSNGNWKSFPKCPYCGKDGSGLYQSKGSSGGARFKCHHTSCPSGTGEKGGSWDEIGFLAFEHRLSRTDAAVLYLKEAGVWQERERYAPSVMPGKAARKRPLPSPSPLTPLPEGEGNPAPKPNLLPPADVMHNTPAETAPHDSAVAELSASCHPGARLPSSREESVTTGGEVAFPGTQPRAEGATASPAGPPPAPGDASQFAEVRPPTSGGGGEAASNFPAQAGDPGLDGASATGGDATAPATLDEEELIRLCLEVIRSEQKASVSLFQRRLRLGYSRAAALMDELEKRGVVGPAKGAEPRDILNLGAAAGDSRAPGEGEEESFDAAAAAAAGDSRGPGEPPPNNIVPMPFTGPEGEDEDDEAAGKKPGGPSPSQRALRWFYRRLHLSNEDRDALWAKRGLTALTCFALGYRSNPQANREILLQMADHFPPAVLVDCGLWSDGRRPGDKPKPNPQFYGMSLVVKRDERGKKIKDEDGEDVMECVWDHPLLIPYFNAVGDLVHIRPHKGMMRDKPPRFYVARPGKQAMRELATTLQPALALKPEFGIVTEGEFKAGALWQVLGQGRALEGALGLAGAGLAAVGSLPGITMAKPLYADIEEWLDEVQVRQVVIGYDSEEKGDPKLPGYQPDEWRRHDAQIWARYLSSRLSKEGYDGKVCVLPKAWRDGKGKADWDGALRAATIRLGRSLEAGSDTDEVWLKVAAKVRADWAEVLHASAAAHELWQLGLFESKDERLIKNGLERISYEPRLSHGTDQETAISRRFHRLLAKRANRSFVLPKDWGHIMLLAKKYQELHGRYYIFKPLREAKEDYWKQLMIRCSEMSDVEMKRACEIVLKGIPEPISDFVMKAHYVLRRMNGKHSRIVSIRSVNGWESRLLTLPSTEFTQPTKWRDWLHDNTQGASWEAGERELQRLHADTAREMAFMQVQEVPLRGYHAESKLWFFKDVTYTPDGTELREDRQGIIWYNNQGYWLSDRDHEGQTFRHADPRMKPDRSAVDAVKGWDEFLRGGVTPASEPEALQIMLRTLCDLMFQTIGDYDGFQVLGTVLALGAGPEIFETYCGLPGLWIHGEPRQGKTSVARWMMRVWGFTFPPSHPGGVVLKDSTKVGLSIALQQYGYLPIWLEEYQASPPDWMVEKLKNIFDRSAGSKKTFEEGDRQILAAAVVTGVATSTDAQLRSRFAHVQVSASRRKGNFFEWFQKESEHFYLLGRFILRNRKAFAQRVMTELSQWMSSPEMRTVDPRSQLMHGVAYAGLTAMWHLLGVDKSQAEAFKNYKKFLVSGCTSSVRDVTEQVNVNLFWRDLLDALPSDAFGETPYERQKVFKVVENKKAESPVSQKQLEMGAESPYTAWKSCLLYFRPGPVIDMLRRYKRLQGRDLPLDQNDLRAQMRTRGYWVEPKRDVHKMKFGSGSQSAQSCWCIDLDQHELGYTEIGDEEFEKSLYRDGVTTGAKWPSTEWVDPRRGDLFTLVDMLKGKQEDQGTL